MSEPGDLRAVGGFAEHGRQVAAAGLPNVASTVWTSRVLGLRGKLATPRSPTLFASPLRRPRRMRPLESSLDGARRWIRPFDNPWDLAAFNLQPHRTKRSSFRATPSSLRKFVTLSGSTWPRLNARSFCASMKRVKSRRWNELSPCFPCAPAKSSGARTTIVSPLRSRMARRGAGASTKRRGNRLRLRSLASRAGSSTMATPPPVVIGLVACRSLACAQLGRRSRRKTAAGKSPPPDAPARRCSVPSERPSVRRQAPTFDGSSLRRAGDYAPLRRRHARPSVEPTLHCASIAVIALAAMARTFALRGVDREAGQSPRMCVFASPRR